jgi:hypothetical protein
LGIVALCPSNPSGLFSANFLLHSAKAIMNTISKHYLPAPP